LLINEIYSKNALKLNASLREMVIRCVPTYAIWETKFSLSIEKNITWKRGWCQNNGI